MIVLVVTVVSDDGEFGVTFALVVSFFLDVNMSLNVCLLDVTVNFELAVIVASVAISVVNFNMLLVVGLLVVTGRDMPVDDGLASIVVLLVSFAVDVDVLLVMGVLVVSVNNEVADEVVLLVSSVVDIDTVVAAGL